MTLLGGCSINRIAVKAVGGVLSAGGQSTAFTGDDDPELVGDALPFALKLYEILLSNDPGNSALGLSTGQAFASYASAFILTPAGELPVEQFDMQLAMKARAKKLFLRGRGYVMQGLEERRHGFQQALDQKGAEAALALVKKSDIDYLFWTGASWLGAFGSDPFDFSLILTIPRAISLLTKVAEWDDGYGRGAVHELLISFYGSAPADLGGGTDLARQSFDKAVRYSKGLKAGPYVALASTVCVQTQNYNEFKDLLNKALAIDVNADPADRLENTINQRHAKWLLDHADDLFLSTGDNS
jgi:predicted anti-sigma-YlaC factor YlaD